MSGSGGAGGAGHAPVGGVDDNGPAAPGGGMALRGAVGALQRRKLEVPDAQRRYCVEGGAPAQVVSGVGPAVLDARPGPQRPEQALDPPARFVPPQGGLRRRHAVATPVGDGHPVRRPAPSATGFGGFASMAGTTVTGGAHRRRGTDPVGLLKEVPQVATRSHMFTTFTSGQASAS